MNLNISPLQESGLEEADRICSLAFGTFLGHPSPETFMEGHNYIRSRWKANPQGAFVATEGQRIVGSNLATNWGSFSFFGPLTVHPEYWDKKVGSALIQPVLDCFDQWGSRLQGLFTFPHSSKHVSLYQKFGFWPRFLTKILSRPVQPGEGGTGLLYSELSPVLQKEAIAGCRELTDRIYEGLDISPEILSVESQSLGDTVLIEDGHSIGGFAVCHCGEGSEAGQGRCYIKFGALRPGNQPETQLLRLLSGVEALARRRNLEQVAAGTNTGREKITRLLQELGFSTLIQGLAMHRPNDAGFSRSDCFVIDDWR